MKRYLLIFIFAVFSLAAYAKEPNLNVEQLFNGSYNSNQHVAISISKRPEKYFRGININDNKGLVDKAVRLFEKDLPRSTESQDNIHSEGRYRSMKIINNGEEISIGLSITGNSVYLFIMGPMKAFK